MSGPAQTGRPTLRVVSGDATPEEVAAILAIVAARSAGAAASGPDTDEAVASTWASPAAAHRTVRARFTPGRHGWRTSYWPH